MKVVSCIGTISDIENANDIISVLLLEEQIDNKKRSNVFKKGDPGKIEDDNEEFEFECGTEKDIEELL